MTQSARRGDPRLHTPPGPLHTHFTGATMDCTHPLSDHSDATGACRICPDCNGYEAASHNPLLTPLQDAVESGPAGVTTLPAPEGYFLNERDEIVDADGNVVDPRQVLEEAKQLAADREVAEKAAAPKKAPAKKPARG